MDIIEDINNNDYSVSNLHYPDDLGNGKLGHFINFYINTPTNTKVQYPNIDNSPKYIYGSDVDAKSAMGNLDSIANMHKSSDFGLAEETVKFLDKYLSNELAEGAKDMAQGLIDIIFKAGSTNLIGVISLYMPDTVNTTHQALYDNKSFTSVLPHNITNGILLASIATKFGTSIADRFAKEGFTLGALRSIGGDLASSPEGQELVSSALFGGKSTKQLKAAHNLSDIVLAKSNYAINPLMQVIFHDMGFRTFQFDFMLTPKNKKEADSIKEIIKQFKYHQAPEISPGSFGRYYITPSTFEIEYMYKGARNENLNKISTCVLTAVNVDYAPTGWITYEDGFPVQTRLILQFQETEMLHKKRIEEGY